MDPIARLEWAIEHMRAHSAVCCGNDGIDYEQVLIAMQEAMEEIKTLRADVVITRQMSGFREIKDMIAETGSA